MVSPILLLQSWYHSEWHLSIPLQHHNEQNNNTKSRGCVQEQLWGQGNSRLTPVPFGVSTQQVTTCSRKSQAFSRPEIFVLKVSLRSRTVLQDSIPAKSYKTINLHHNFYVNAKTEAEMPSPYWKEGTLFPNFLALGRQKRRMLIAEKLIINSLF